MNKFSIKDITIIAVFSAIIVIQEQLLSFLPNIQLTVFLLVLYSKKLGFIRSSIIVVIHTILDNLFMGSFNIIYFIPMLIGWLIIPIVICSLFNKTSSPIILALMGVVFSFIYSWIFIIPNVIFLSIDPWAYLLSDIIFELILAVSSFVTILWLYNPTSRIIDKFYSKEEKKNLPENI